MDILVVSSTLAEIQNFLDYLAISQQINKNFFRKNFFNHNIDIAVCGIGTYNTLYNLTKLFQNKKYDIAINVGIAGAFNKNIQITEVVFVEKEIIGDFLIEEEQETLTILNTTLININEFPFENGYLVNKNKWLIDNFKYRKVTGLTSNTVTSNHQKAQKLINMFNADIETMEGAAFFFTCLNEKIPFVEIRSISNYTESKLNNQWSVAEAIESLNRELKIYILELMKNFS